MVKCTERGLVVKRPGVLSKVQLLNLVLGVGVFSLLPSFGNPDKNRGSQRGDHKGCIEQVCCFILALIKDNQQQIAHTILLPWAICRNVLEDFCCINFGGFSRGFSWKIFLGTFSHKNEEKISGEKIREKIRRLKNKNPRKIRSAESRP